jgi:hypothetical protein
MHFFRFGFPGVIISDQGREFCNHLIEQLLTLTGTTHRVTSAYHPQSNGMTGMGAVCGCVWVSLSFLKVTEATVSHDTMHEMRAP